MTPTQSRFVAALFSHSTILEAAQSVSVTDRTARRWLSDPEIIAAIKAFEADLLESVNRRLATLAADAVETMADALEDDAPGIRLRAADLITQRRIQYRENTIVEQRLAELEALLEGRNEH